MQNTSTRHTQTANTAEPERPTGDLAAIAITGGGLIGAVGGVGVGAAVGGAVIGIATGGVGLLVGGAVGGIVTLAMWLTQKNKYSAEQKQLLNADQEQLRVLEQQPAIIVHAVIANINQHVDTIVTQSHAQHLRTDSNVRALTDVITRTNQTAQPFTHVKNTLHEAAETAVNHVHAMQQELHLVRQDFQALTVSLLLTQQSLTETETRLRETQTKLAFTEEQLAQNSLDAQQQLTHLFKQQRLIDEALRDANPETIRNEEMDAMKQQILDLSASNRRLNAAVTALSEKMMQLIKDNTALKRTITFFLQTPEHQGALAANHPTQAHSEEAEPVSIGRFRANTH